MSAYSENFPGNFIEAAHIPQDREIKLTIKSYADRGSVKSADGRTIDRPVVYFEETDKGWAVNKTNARILALLIGDMPSWAGKKITLSRGLVKHPGHPDLPVIMMGRLKMTYGLKVKLPDA